MKRLMLAAITVVALSGCTSAPSVSTGEYAGSIDDFEVEMIGDTSALWVDGGERIAILTGGSSSCAPYPTAVSVVDGTIEIQTARAGGDVCTADMAAITFEVETPAGVDAGSAVDVVLVSDDLRTELTVPAL